MQTFKTRGFTVLGPCPGCESWTLEYPRDVMMEWPTYDAWVDAVEGILQEHMTECSGLREIMFDTV